jgi:glycosyltransferase involved in cell wall biosynthesis
MIQQAQLQIARRYRQLHDIWNAEGYRGISNRVRTAAADRLMPKDIVLPVRSADVMAANLDRSSRGSIPTPLPGQQLALNWVMTPPSRGSGGHSTMFRIINYLEAHGYLNRIYFYDVYRGDHQYYSSIVRHYYEFGGPIAKVDDGMQDAHGVVATAWPTAYPVFNSGCAGKRFYFVQDFEPSFHAIGTSSVLAENTYRMGFHAITAGIWLAQKLSAEFGMKADHFEFGCDLSRYRRISESRRSGVAFYARPAAARRGFELGLMAFQMFAERRPDIDIHFYGDKIGKLPFRFIDHGRVAPDQLNDIYNHCYGGLSLSLTNVSLVPHEMLAAGCIPVVNDAAHNRVGLKNPYVRYATLTPHALAAELESLVSMSDFGTLSMAAAKSVQSTTWDDAGATVDASLRRALQ